MREGFVDINRFESYIIANINNAHAALDLSAKNFVNLIIFADAVTDLVSIHGFFFTLSRYNMLIKMFVSALTDSTKKFNYCYF